MRPILALAALLIAAPAGAETFPTTAGPVEVAAVAGPFDHPWALAFLPGGDLLVTERDEGRLWQVTPGGERREIAGAPEVDNGGQGGLLDVVVARDFAESGLVFLSYAEPAGGGKARTAVLAARLEGGRLADPRVIFRQEPAVRSGQHFGSRIVEAPDGTLWITTGDRGLKSPAQDPDTHIGKVIRITRDGDVPADNPFTAGGVLPEIWSFGHRNAQGAALDPATGSLFTVEHGARGGDEINQPRAGRNYGWPVISYGVNYDGSPIGQGQRHPEMEQPLWYWDPSIAPSGMAIYSGRLWPDWEGHIFVGALKAQLLQRIGREGGSLTAGEQLFEDEFGRIRDVREGPDGAIWFLTDEPDGMVYRMAPAE